METWDMRSGFRLCLGTWYTIMGDSGRCRERRGMRWRCFHAMSGFDFTSLSYSIDSIDECKLVILPISSPSDCLYPRRTKNIRPPPFLLAKPRL
jgi:hypothetical protein